MSRQFFVRDFLQPETISVPEFWPQIIVLILLVIAILFLGNYSQ